MQIASLSADDWLMHARSIRSAANLAQRVSDTDNARVLHQAADEVERRARLAAAQLRHGGSEFGK